MFSVTSILDYGKGGPDPYLTTMATYETYGFEFPGVVGLYDAKTRQYTILSQWTDGVLESNAPLENKAWNCDFTW
jgi:hypothetical protein